MSTDEHVNKKIMDKDIHTTKKDFIENLVRLVELKVITTSKAKEIAEIIEREERYAKLLNLI